MQIAKSGIMNTRTQEPRETVKQKEEEKNLDVGGNKKSKGKESVRNQELPMHA